MNWLEIICLIIIIICIIISAMMLYEKDPAEISRKNENGSSIVRVKANRRLNRIKIVAKADQEDIHFERKEVKKGETVEFLFPLSMDSADITLEEESGKTRFFEV